MHFQWSIKLNNASMEAFDNYKGKFVSSVSKDITCNDINSTWFFYIFWLYLLFVCEWLFFMLGLITILLPICQRWYIHIYIKVFFHFCLLQLIWHTQSHISTRWKTRHECYGCCKVIFLYIDSNRRLWFHSIVLLTSCMYM